MWKFLGRHKPGLILAALVLVGVQFVQQRWLAVGLWVLFVVAVLPAVGELLSGTKIDERPE